MFAAQWKYLEQFRMKHRFSIMNSQFAVFVGFCKRIIVRICKCIHKESFPATVIVCGEVWIKYKCEGIRTVKKGLLYEANADNYYDK